MRVPQALENTKLTRLAKKGSLQQEELVALERHALNTLRAYDRDEIDLDSTLDAVLAYAAPAMLGAKLDELPGSRSVAGLRARYERTLADRPWSNFRSGIGKRTERQQYEIQTTMPHLYSVL